MTGTTASGWPYVEPSDHPKEYPTHSQALTAKLESHLDLTAGVVAAAGAWAISTQSLHVSAGWVILRVTTSKAAAATSGEVFANVPTDFRPPVAFFGFAQGATSTAGGHKIYLFHVAPNGELAWRGTAFPAGAEVVQALIVYPVAGPLTTLLPALPAPPLLPEPKSDP